MHQPTWQARNPHEASAHVLLGLSVDRAEVDGETNPSGPYFGTMSGAQAHFDEGFR